MTDIVRTCEKTYSEDVILKQNIRIHVIFFVKLQDLKFNDGDFPNNLIISKFMIIVNNVFQSKIDDEKNVSSDKTPCVAIHCIAGLGR